MRSESAQSAPAGDVAANLAAVKERIAMACAESGRAGGSVTLVVVTKTFGPELVLPVLIAGHRVFGENRLQEAQAKWPALKERFPDVELHLIGPLQTNKAKAAVRLFDAIHTVDRAKLARVLAKEMAEEGRRPRCYIEVNTGEEAQKHGVAPEAADALIRECRDELGLPVEGLMCIPPLNEEPSLHFALLREIARRNGLRGLSMGMSADYETAIEFGATLVRVGSAIFGARA
jgi:pyridoxal phosphate enzyme (YggS family)